MVYCTVYYSLLNAGKPEESKFQENITSPELTYTEGPGKLIFKLQINTGFYYFSGLLFYLRSSCRLAISS